MCPLSVCHAAKNDYDRRLFSVFFACENFFSGEMFKLPFEWIALTVDVADSLTVSFKAGQTISVDFVEKSGIGNTRPLVGETEAGNVNIGARC